MNRSTPLRTLTLVLFVVSGSCNSESEPDAPKTTKSSSKTRSTKTEMRPETGGQADPVDAGAADGGETEVEIAAPSDAGDGAATENPDPGGAPDRGPYFDSDAWRGYLWTAYHGEGTTLTSTNFSAAKFEAPVCIKGLVAATPDSSGNAMLGLNVDQAHRGDAPTHTVVPSHEGVSVDVTNPGASPLRIQVHAPDGATNGEGRWCAMVTGAGGFIPWTQFNTACWDRSGKPYAREPISAALLLVPGNTAMPMPYEVCLLGLSEADAAP